MLKNIDRWIVSYMKREISKIFSAKGFEGPTHIMFAITDHYEPDWNQADIDTQKNRVAHWINDFPPLAKKHKDADGKHPQYTFFYPAECYNQDHLKELKKICNQGLGEVEVHLHHENDTEKSLRVKLERAKEDFGKHGYLGRRVLSGQIRYGFIHGNWCLNNSRKDGQWCGVNNETNVLHDTGCYADFTFPSAPSETQPKKINSIYYSKSNANKSKSHNKGIDVKVGRFTNADLMLIQGPLTLNWKDRKKWFFPRIENAEISHANLPRETRIDLWVDQQISVQGKPDWIFVKIHTHGAPEKNADVLLGDPMGHMYDYLETKYNDGEKYILHYVTAREMYNIVKAAEAGEPGDPNMYRDYMIERNSSRE